MRLFFRRREHWVDAVLQEQRDKKWLYEKLKEEDLPIPADLKDEFERQSTGFGIRPTT